MSKGLTVLGLLAGVLVFGNAPDARAQASGKSAAVTFTRDVAPILVNRCMRCHRPGEIAPMSLRSYEEARPWARSIKREVVSRAMPPWHADPQYGEFSNDARLSDEEVATIVAWVDARAPRGAPADMPELPKFEEGWQLSHILGPPDFVAEMENDFFVPAGGPDININIPVPLTLDEDVWVIAAEVRGNPRIVHHNTVSLRRPDGSRDPSGRLASIVPGKQYDLFAKGSGKFIKAGSSLRFGLHYHPSGQEETDRSRVGLWLAKEPLVWQVYTAAPSDRNLVIPPNEPNHLSVGEWTVEFDAELTLMKPHMHYRGKDIEYKAVYPDGREEILLSVLEYDMNWQMNYELAEPIKLPKGTTIVVTAHFDNSVENLWNPDPNMEVHWGDDSRDEMMEGWLDYRRRLETPIDPTSRQQQQQEQ